MKRFLPILFVLPLLLAACEQPLPIDGVEIITSNVEGLTPLISSNDEKVANNDYFVTTDHLNLYLQKQQFSSNKTKRVVNQIIPLGPNTNEPLMYVVNYNNGWDIISADQRTIPIIATSHSGTFDMDKLNPGVLAWLNGLAFDITNLRTSSANKQTATTQQNNKNVKLWNGILQKDEYEKKFGKNTFDNAVEIHDPSILNTRANEGHYEYRYSEVEHIPIDTTFHLTVTKWGQWDPWNFFCPTDDNVKCPAGCTAVAGGQMAYFLHNHLGVPVNAMLDSSFYVPLTSINDTNVWDIMVLDKDDYVSPSYTIGHLSVARLIRDIGERVDMEYTSEGSGAWSEDLIENVFNPYGISCDFANYNPSTVISALKQGMPSIVEAFSEKNTNWLGITTYSGGHTFIIDGYINYQTITKDFYEWVFDGEIDFSQLFPFPLRLVETTTSAPWVGQICMNWGWSDLYNEIWVSPSEDWIVPSDTQPNFIYRRRMTTGFRVTNQ